MTDNSDYKKPRTNLFEELPSVYQSDINRSLFENTFNRHLTKTDLTKVVGTVGKFHQGVAQDRRLDEDTAHRQAFQLQPLIRTTVATVDHVMSYNDVLNELKRLGVDVDRLPKWGNSTKFNFIPPVDLDKIINYTDYFWYDPIAPNSTPQYITIENVCSKAEARLQLKQAELDISGNNHPITNIDIIDNTFNIVNDLSSQLQPGVEFQIETSTFNDGIYTVVTSVFENAVTTITVAEVIPSDVIIDGALTFNNMLSELTAEVTLHCVTSPVTNPWIEDNFWVHKLDLLPGLASVSTRAEQPIIEYLNSLQLNEWIHTKHNWSYRASTSEAFGVVENEPTTADIASGDFLDLWLYNSQSSPVPTDIQTLNISPTNASTALPLPSLTTGDNFSYDLDVTLHNIAFGGSNDIRVYVDGIQQYGTYLELVDGFNFVIGVQFLNAQSPSSEITIGLNSAAEDDSGREFIEVRTIFSSFSKLNIGNVAIMVQFF